MGKIIKGQGTPDAISAPGRETAAADPAKVIEREVLLAHDEARRIIEKAQQRARDLVEEAQGEADRRREEARLEGREEGLADWQDRILEIGSQLDHQMDEIRPQLLELGLKVAGKILRRQLDREPEAMLPMVDEALETLRGYRSGHITLRCHPGDVELLERHRDQALVGQERFRHLEVVGDGGLDRGGCRIETEFGTVDASLETQLRIVERLMRRGSAR